MSTLREAAQQALDRLRMYYYGTGFAEDAECIAALERALARKQAERVCKCDLRTRLVGDGCEVCNPELAAELAQERAEPVQEPVAWIHRQGDFWEFGCHRLTDGEKARGWTEEPLYLTPPKAEPVQPLFNATVVDDAHPNGIPLEQWVRSGNPPQRKPLTEGEIRRICDEHWSLRQLARAIERAHGIKE